jgi:hypothetical protein
MNQLSFTPKGPFSSLRRQTVPAYDVLYFDVTDQTSGSSCVIVGTKKNPYGTLINEMKTCVNGLTSSGACAGHFAIASTIKILNRNFNARHKLPVFLPFTVEAGKKAANRTFLANMDHVSFINGATNIIQFNDAALEKTLPGLADKNDLENTGLLATHTGYGEPVYINLAHVHAIKPDSLLQKIIQWSDVSKDELHIKANPYCRVLFTNGSTLRVESLAQAFPHGDANLLEIAKGFGKDPSPKLRESMVFTSHARIAGLSSPR